MISVVFPMVLVYMVWVCVLPLELFLFYALAAGNLIIQKKKEKKKRENNDMLEILLYPDQVNNQNDL